MLSEEKLQELIDAIQELLDTVYDISIMTFRPVEEILSDPAVYIDGSWLAVEDMNTLH